MKTSPNGIVLIEEFESFRSNPYLDVVGVPTIGYGATYYENGIRVSMYDKPISNQRGLELLLHNLIPFEDAINSIDTGLNQNQFDALMSLIYNIGIAAFKSSTLLKCLINSDIAGASDQFERWDHGNGKVLQGLLNRRLKEKQLFLK